MFCRRRDCKWVSCLLWLFTALLGLLLVAQIPFVLLFVFDREIRIPRQWVGSVSQAFPGEDREFSARAVFLDKHGTLRLRDAELRTVDGRRIAAADLVAVDLFLPSTLLGFPRLERVEASNVRFWNFRGRLGMTDPIGEILGVRLRRDPLEWQILDFRARFGDLRLAASGAFRRQDWEGAADGRDPDPTAWLERAPEAKTEIARCVDPFLLLRFARDEDRPARADLSFSADRVELPFDLALDGDIRLAATATAADGFTLTEPIRVRADRLTHGEDLQVDSPRLGLRPPPGFPAGNRFGGGRAEISAARVVDPEATLEWPTASLEAREGLRLAATGQAGLFGNPFSFDAAIRPLRRAVDLRAEGLLAVDELLRHPAVPPEAREPTLDFGEGLYVRAKTGFRLGDGLPETVGFRVESGPAYLEGFRTRHAVAEGRFRPREEALEVDRLDVWTADYHLGGTYRHDFRTNRFRFLVRGGFLPGDLDGWMRPWWEELWAEFRIPRPAHIDLDLTGDWDFRDERRLFGGIRFEDLGLRGMTVEKGHARIRSRPYFFELFDLRAYRPEGEASGSMANLLDWNTREDSATIYDFSSTFALDQIDGLFGEEVAKIVADFSLAAPPELEVEGTLIPGPPGSTDPREELVVRARTDRALTYRGISLENLSLEANYANEILRLEPLRFGLGGGEGEGWAIRRGAAANAEHPFSFGLEFRGGSPAAVTAAIPAVAEAVGDRFTADSDDASGARKLDFSIECSGDPEAPETLVGEGNIDLHSPNLANVRLLGIFSRISEELPLPITLGSFQFQRARSSFLLNRGLVEFPDLSLHSPSSRLLASGSYEMDDGTVDFDARMNLLGETNFPVLTQLGLLLNPVGRVFEFRVWGPLEDLNWRLYLDPRSWG